MSNYCAIALLVILYVNPASAIGFLPSPLASRNGTQVLSLARSDHQASPNATCNVDFRCQEKNASHSISTPNGCTPICYQIGNWCWAASIAALGAYYKGGECPQLECEVVNYDRHRSDCCPTAPSSPCASFAGDISPSTFYHFTGRTLGYIQGTFNEAALASRLAQGPVIIAVVGPPAHAYYAAGCDSTGYWILDDQVEIGWQHLTYQEILTNYHGLLALYWAQ
ncbi:hypothetical protein CYMTET_53774 [Cymbomonas tetramitiformis]|uniref:Uncharacterized protein n=1 Tax=Cymbomonas tetramitiformis TaxID=36881 RepID=A0AAE0BHP3_9CHLO|nr:hypothetical protein CYMTET_53774 [Cymbomonas tetramitiformis]